MKSLTERLEQDWAHCLQRWQGELGQNYERTCIAPMLESLERFETSSDNLMYAASELTQAMAKVERRYKEEIEE